MEEHLDFSPFGAITNSSPSWAWQCTPLKPVHRRWRQVDLYELEVSMAYIMSSRPARAALKNKNEYWCYK